MGSPRRIVSLVRGRYQYAMDVAAWVLALLIAVTLRYDLQLDRLDWISFLFICVTAAVLQLVVGWAFGLYAGHFVLGSFHEIRALTIIDAIVGVVLGVVVILASAIVDFPRSTVFMSLPLALVIMAALRYVQRVYVEGRARPGDSAERVLVYGAGYLARHLSEVPGLFTPSITPSCTAQPVTSRRRART